MWTAGVGEEFEECGWGTEGGEDGGGWRGGGCDGGVWGVREGEKVSRVELEDLLVWIRLGFVHWVVLIALLVSYRCCS